MREQIENLFKNIEEKPLFYIESGSRLWRIASPDSDYDVRGFHLQSSKQYYDFKRHRDIIEVMDGDFDFVSYDVDKMFGLLAKSNPTVFEWIRANIVYLNELPDWTTFQQAIIANFDFKALFHHYISLAKGHSDLMVTGKKFTYKTAFYCIRGLLSADLATRKIIPELLTLVFSSVGYVPKEVLITNLNNLTIVLELDEGNLEEVVVVGYGTQRRKELTGSISSIKSTDLEKVASNSFTGAIQGKVPGVTITNTSGAPGGASSVRIDPEN